jgi:hypothetical protein
MPQCQGNPEAAMSKPANDETPEPHDTMIDVINEYKKQVDRTLLRENLQLTVEERIRKAEKLRATIDGWQGAADLEAIAALEALREEWGTMRLIAAAPPARLAPHAR